MTDEQPKPPQQSSSAWGKFGAVLVGLVLVIMGIGAVIPEGEKAVDGMTRTLGALSLSLGVGVIASVLLPHTIEVDGKSVKPFGVDVKASGGAAVFVLCLLFVVFGASGFSDEQEPEPEKEGHWQAITTAGGACNEDFSFCETVTGRGRALTEERAKQMAIKDCELQDGDETCDLDVDTQYFEQPL